MNIKSRNKTRSKRARAVLADLYQNDDTRTDVVDMLTDLQHLCCQRQIDFQQCLRMAAIHFQDET